VPPSRGLHTPLDAGRGVLDFALHDLKGDLFPDLMEMMG
jgi:hypothetical protein